MFVNKFVQARRIFVFLFICSCRVWPEKWLLLRKQTIE